MVVKIDKHGNRYHEPPYTKKKEDEFYRRNARGPIAVARPAGDRKATERDNDGSGTDHSRPGRSQEGAGYRQPRVPAHRSRTDWAALLSRRGRRDHRGSGPFRLGFDLSSSRFIARDRAAASPAVPCQ